MSSRIPFQWRLLVNVTLRSIFLLGIVFPPLQPICAWAAERQMGLSTAIIGVAKKNIPAVVHIEVTER